ncbi:MAG TPA: hypothetical protein VMU84_11335, partial [Thermoanaerobaculia bacterium]|nr:hypothetical protein [Thermoanaerobaculia bacterium]
PADHDRTNMTAALTFVNETGMLTAGVLYDVAHPTLIDEMEEIRTKALGAKSSPTKQEILRAFA